MGGLKEKKKTALKMQKADDEGVSKSDSEELKEDKNNKDLVITSSDEECGNADTHFKRSSCKRQKKIAKGKKVKNAGDNNDHAENNDCIIKQADELNEQCARTTNKKSIDSRNKRTKSSGKENIVAFHPYQDRPKRDRKTPDRLTYYH